jgi:hypothetical protein
MRKNKIEEVTKTSFVGYMSPTEKNVVSQLPPKEEEYIPAWRREIEPPPVPRFHTYWHTQEYAAKVFGQIKWGEGKEKKPADPLPRKHLALVAHKEHGSSYYEVGVKNLYGSIRLADFWSVPGATEKECVEFIIRLEEAAHQIHADIMRKRESAKNPK